MKVFLVKTGQEWETHFRDIAVFSTYEKAKKYVDKCNNYKDIDDDDDIYYLVSPFYVDEKEVK
jgi:hypothetical protein